MAVLGDGGRVTLKRQSPEAYSFSPEDHLGGKLSYATWPPVAFWSGDAVTLYSARGIPADAASCPDGVGMYRGSTWHLGPNRSHVTSPADDFFQDDDNVDFYQEGSPLTSFDAWLGLDQLGRASFYATRAEALSGKSVSRLAFKALDFGSMEMALDQETMPWVAVGNLQSWQITLDAASADTSGVGQKFGSAVKSLVTGGGSFDFFFDATGGSETIGTQAMTNLLLMTEQGAAADLELDIFRDRHDDCSDRLPGDLYYRLSALVTQVAVNTRSTDLITGSASFVTTDEVKLIQGPA